MGIRVQVLGDLAVTVRELVEAAAGGHGVLIQYVPFLYGRRGVSSLPLRFARLLRARGLSVTVFVHEPWVPPTRLPWLVLSYVQRRQLRRLLAEADRAVTAVPAWVRLLGAKVSALAVGSTLGNVRDIDSIPTEPLNTPVVVSPFASGLRWDWVLAASHSLGPETALTVIGATRHEALARGLELPSGADGWNWLGYLPAPEAMDTLLRAPLVLAPFGDGLTTRRTSAMAALAAGARLVSSTGHLYDPLFARDCPVRLEGTRDSFAAAARTICGTPDSLDSRKERITWYNERMGDERLDRQLAGTILGSTFRV